MSDRPSTTLHPIFDSAGRVSVDLACVNCQYNLRTLAIGRFCCECGTPVLYTLHSRHIQFSPPTWLRTLIHGCLLIVVAPAVPILLGFVFMPWSTCRPAILEDPLLIVPALALVAIGAWMITRPDPLIRKFTRRREPVRCLLAAATIAWAVFMAVVLCLPRSTRNAVPGLVDIAVVAYVVGGSLLLVLLTRHLWNLVRRGASRGILAIYQVVFWTTVALSVLVVVMPFRDHGLALILPVSIEVGWRVLLPTSLIATHILVILTATIIAVARRRSLSFPVDGRGVFETT